VGFDFSVVKISGEAVVGATQTRVSGGVFRVNTSGTQFPNTAGKKHVIKLMQSAVVWIGGASTVKSGLGYMLAGNPLVDGQAQAEFTVDNLNRLYGIGQTSAVATYLSFNT
jgi:hypothetical protein